MADYRAAVDAVLAEPAEAGLSQEELLAIAAELTAGCRGLRIGQATAPTFLQPKPRRAQRNGARGNDDYFLSARLGCRNLCHQAFQPVAPHPLLADQQRRADLDHQAGASGLVGKVGKAGNLHALAD